MLGAAVSSASYAATVKALKGRVLLDRGEGYKLIDRKADARPGDKVIVNPGSMAQIVYPDGCSVDVVRPAVVPIEPQSPCQTQRAWEPTVTTAPPQAPPPADVPAAPPPNDPGGLSGTTMILGGVAVGAGIAGAIILIDQNDKPASP
jgi:hypothetical protein